MNAGHDRILRSDGLAPWDDRILAGDLELTHRQPTDPDRAVRLGELIDRMSDGHHSAAALDRMAALVAQLLVPDRLVEDLVRTEPARRG